MGGAEEPPSASQPFLSKSYPSPIIDEPNPDSTDHDQTQYLQISFNYGPRRFKDVSFLILFVFLALATYCFGIFSVFNRNRNSSDSADYSYDDTSQSCVQASNATTLLASSLYPRFVTSNHVLRDLIWTLVITLVFSAPLSFLILVFLKHFTKQLVYVSIPLFIFILIFFDVYWFVACTVTSSCSESFPLAYRILLLVSVLLIIGVFVWIIVVNWYRIELTVRIIGVASNALSRNLGLFLVLPCLTLALCAYFAPIAVFLLLARSNGKIIAHKLDEEYYSCVWKTDAWVPAYYALAILTILWSTATMIEAQVYVISGTIARWYFSKDDFTPKRSIRSSVRNAFGTSFGTVCLSGLLVCVVRVVRFIVESANEGSPGVFNIILRCCVNTCLGSIDFLNKFSINFAAIIGESYCLSARMTYELLKRNLLSAVFVDTISTRLLAGIAFIASAIYAVVVFAILKKGTSLGDGSYFVAGMACVLLMVVMGWFVHVLDNVIETVYVCYAVDRDKGDVFKQDIHEVYVHLPITRDRRQSLIPSTLTFL